MFHVQLHCPCVTEVMDASDIIDAIRAACLSRGIHGIKGLAVLFRRLDIDFSKAVILEEFVDGLTQYGVEIPRDDLCHVFRHLDKNHSGSVDFREFLLELASPMSQCRVDVVNQAFDKMDVNGDGCIQMDDLKGKHTNNQLDATSIGGRRPRTCIHLLVDCNLWWVPSWFTQSKIRVIPYHNYILLINKVVHEQHIWL